MNSKSDPNVLLSTVGAPSPKIHLIVSSVAILRENALDFGFVVATGGKARWSFNHLVDLTDLQIEAHSDAQMPLKMTVHQPEPYKKQKKGKCVYECRSTHHDAQWEIPSF